MGTLSLYITNSFSPISAANRKTREIFVMFARRICGMRITSRIDRGIYFAPADGRAGSDKKQTLIRPNLSFINQLRGAHNLPVLDGSKLPVTIRNILIIDDVVELSEVIADTLCVRFSDLTEKKAVKARAGSVPAPSSHNIFIAVLESEIEKMIAEAQGLDIDMVITDFNMYPNLSGGDVIRRMRGAGYPGLIIGMTGRDSNLRKFYGAGADLVALKPVEVNLFFDLICSGNGDTKL